MPRLPGQSLCLGIDHDSLALVRRSRLFGAASTVLAEVRIDDAADGAALLRGLRQLGEAAPLAGWPVSVVLADELARMWQVAPPPAAASPADLEAACAMRYQALFGAPPTGWTIAADWRAGEPFLAAALPDALLSTLLAWSRAAGCHVVEVVPQLVAAMNAWRKQRRPGAWFGLVHGQVLSIAAYDGARLVALRSTVVPPGAGRDWLDSLIAREALRVGVQRPDRLQVCGPAPRSWASHEGRLKFGCTLLDGEDAPSEASSIVRLARTGSAT